ncbi:MAG: ketopantoate reductase family protein, partial [Burkholderiales bacterium]
MKICIFGAGAIGGVMAAWLEKAGHEVSMVARGANLEAIRAKGLRIRTNATGEILTAHPKVDSDPGKLGIQDYVVLTVKGQSLPQVAATIGPLLGPDSSVVTAMNGVPWWFFDKLAYGGGKLRLESLDPGGRLSQAMPTKSLVGCVIHCAASVPEPGLVSHNMGKKLILGEPGGKNTARTTKIAEAFAAAGFDTITSGFIEKDFWVKLLGNVSFNP